MEYPTGLGNVRGTATSRRDAAAQDNATPPACRKNPLRVTRLISIEAHFLMLWETRGISLFIFDGLTRRRVVTLWEVRREVENDLEPPIWFVGNLNGSAAQVALRAKQDIEY